MRDLDLSVVAPCFNEEANVRELGARVLATFERGSLSGELVLVDDGSRDRTREIVEELERETDGRVVGRFHDRNLGIAAAWRTGVGAARAPLVAIIDADLQYQPEDLLRLRRALLDHSVDVVQGWRSAIGRERDSRYHLSRGLNALLNAAFGMSLRDNKSGFVMASKGVMQDLLAHRGSYSYWQSFIMVAAHAKGYSYKEIETLFEARRAGRSFLDGQTAKAVAKSFVDLGRAAVEYRIRKQPATDPGEVSLRARSVVDRSPRRSRRREAYWKSYLAAFDRTHWIITRDVERRYETLEKTQWLEPRDLRELQDEKLRRLIRHAWRNVPFYRERMRERGLRPEDIRTQADLAKLPLIGKDDVRKNLYFDILSENHEKSEILRVTTSGSTGEPFVCFADRAQLEFRWAATLRSQEWTGYQFGDPCVRLWHQTLGLTPGQERRERLDALLSRRKFVPVFEMSEQNLDLIAAEIASHRPTLVDGYAEAFDLIAQYLSGRGRTDVRAGAVMSSAQTLPEASRALIERAFGCRVFDKYGAREFSGIAYECEAHDGHHVVGEGFIVEILRDGRPARPGEIGEVVITDLNNQCLPFLRYRIGDLAVAMDDSVPCRCGRGLPRIGAIEGRVQSIIVGVDGQYLPGTFFAHYLREFSHAIARYQVIQEKRGSIRLRVVKGGRWSESVLEEILVTFRRFLGKSLEVQVELVDDVVMIPTGKRLASVSSLAIDFQEKAPERAVG